MDTFNGAALGISQSPPSSRRATPVTGKPAPVDAISIPALLAEGDSFNLCARQCAAISIPALLAEGDTGPALRLVAAAW